MKPRFVGRVGLADTVTIANAMLGFVAAALAMVDPFLAARLVLLAAIADGLDGVIARYHGSTPMGDFLDSLADVASFGVAPAMLVVGAINAQTGLLEGPIPQTLALLNGPTALLGAVAVLLVPALFVAMAITRLALYTAYDLGRAATEGVQTTLAGTLLAATYLTGYATPLLLLGATALFCYLMVAPITYPELHARDALIMGVVQALAIAFPRAFGGLFPSALLVAALAYFALAPRFYWREA
jgi:archaetidylserine synthase